jgi:hypothetical protein
MDSSYNIFAQIGKYLYEKDNEITSNDILKKKKIHIIRKNNNNNNNSLNCCDNYKNGINLSIEFLNKIDFKNKTIIEELIIENYI